MGRVYPRERYVTPERAIEDKLKVLRDFCIVNDENEERYRKVLLLAVRDEPNTQFDIVLDRVAKKLIGDKMYERE